VDFSVLRLGVALKELLKQLPLARGGSLRDESQSERVFMTLARGASGVGSISVILS